MATIAQWGDIKFSVNAKKVFSFKDFKRSYSARYAQHERVGKRPLSEFQGPDLDEVTFEVILDAEMGINPRKTMFKFRDAAKSGKVAYLYINGDKVAINKFVIASGTENWNEIWNKGELIRSTAQITMKEYVESPGSKKKSKNKKKAETKPAKSTSKKNAKKPEAKKKSVDEVVRDIILGKYGNGEERKKKLEAAGYDYDEVQGKVNEKLLK